MADTINNGQAVIVTSHPQEKATQSVRFRPMNLGDILRVHEIDQLSFSLPWPENSYRFELTQNPSTLALVVEIVPQDSPAFVIGMSIVWIISDEAHIATIAIHPNFRGLGFGNRFLAETLRQSIQRGVILATLEVREGNLNALNMYHSFGFIVVGKRLQYYRDNNEDALVMTVEPLGMQYLTWLNDLGT
jgi:ribosomal-protein-alanine N-acetyltransferase